MIAGVSASLYRSNSASMWAAYPSVRYTTA